MASVEVEQPVRNEEPRRCELTKWDAVVFWDWDLYMSDCIICKNHVMTPCATCQDREEQKARGEAAGTSSQPEPTTDDECLVAYGECNHPYHNHCITRWLDQFEKDEHKRCPLDARIWKLKQLGNFGN